MLAEWQWKEKIKQLIGSKRQGQMFKKWSHTEYDNESHTIENFAPFWQVVREDIKQHLADSEVSTK